MNDNNQPYKIEKGVPPPIHAGSVKYPWHEMEVGDSFVVPSDKRTTVQSAAGAINRRTEMRFVVRTVGDVVRVWRIK